MMSKAIKAISVPDCRPLAPAFGASVYCPEIITKNLSAVSCHVRLNSGLGGCRQLSLHLQ